MSTVMTVEEMSRYLKLNPQTVYRKARAGEIPAVKVGGTLRFVREVVDDWMRAASLQWSLERREELRRWGRAWARARRVSERRVAEAVVRRRRRA